MTRTAWTVVLNGFIMMTSGLVLMVNTGRNDGAMMVVALGGFHGDEGVQ